MQKQLSATNQKKNEEDLKKGHVLEIIFIEVPLFPC
jgi:hypothetical protein